MTDTSAENSLLAHLNSDQPAEDAKILDSGELKLELFESLVAQDFSISIAGFEHTLKLVEAKASEFDGPREGGGFTLAFDGSWIRDFTQGNVFLKFPDQTGALLFLVCNGVRGDDAQYQVIFN